MIQTLLWVLYIALFAGLLIALPYALLPASDWLGLNKRRAP